MKKAVRSKKSAFTLIELMFGISILLIVIIVSLSTFINCMFLNESSRNLTTAAHDAQYVLEQIRIQSFSDIPAFISNYPSAQFTNLAGESVSFPGTSFSANIDTVNVQISWNERNVPKTFSITTRFAQ